MSRGVLIAVFALGAATARAQTSRVAEPIRVAIECELVGRTKACPAFLYGLVDAHQVLLAAPRARADVVIYASATGAGNIDRLHLRFVGQLPDAPAAVELDVNLDTRATDDEQRAALGPVFRKGIALFVDARHPSAVDVVLSIPNGLAGAVASGSPWGVELGLAGQGNYTAQYQTVSGSVHLIGRYVRRRFRAFGLQMVQGAMNRQPPLVLDDGTQVLLDSEQWKYRFGAEAIYSWSETWSVGFGSYTFFEDPKAQYDFNSRSRAAIEWDLFPPDDPRGNRLAVFYHLGWMVERYNLRNELGESFAQYPSHGINAVGSVRHDRISFGLNLSSDAQVNHPGRRLLLTAAPFATIQIGNYIDLNLSLSITKRTFPAPDPAAIDPSDFEQLSRLAYAEPLALSGSLGLTFHWDPTNGVRNNRIDSI